METTDLVAFVVPSSLTPSTFTAGGVTFKAIMAQLQHMDSCLDSLTDKICQVNTHIGRIARRQARLGSFAPSPYPSLVASVDEDDDVGDDEDDDAGDDEDDDASSSSDDEITTFQ